jgi:hypothetical protein
MLGRSQYARIRCLLVAFALVSLAAPVAAAERRVALTGFDQTVVDRARSRAAKKLEDPACRQLLTDFRDSEGRTLEDNLDKWGVSAAEYLLMIPFLDGSSQRLCRWSKVDLVTNPGVPRVFVCSQFAATEMRDPWTAEAAVIHEMLHTLGLGENPPTSTEITKRVKGRCQ